MFQVIKAIINQCKHWLPAGSQHFRTKCFPFAQHMYVQTLLPSTFMIYMWMILWQWIKSPLNGSCCLRMRHITSGCFVLPLKTSCDLESCHLWMRPVAVLHVLQRNLNIRMYRETTASLPYLRSRRSSLVVSNGLPPTLHLGFSHISFC